MTELLVTSGVMGILSPSGEELDVLSSPFFCCCPVLTVEVLLTFVLFPSFTNLFVRVLRTAYGFTK